MSHLLRGGPSARSLPLSLSTTAPKRNVNKDTLAREVGARLYWARLFQAARRANYKIDDKKRTALRSHIDLVTATYVYSAVSDSLLGMQVLLC